MTGSVDALVLGSGAHGLVAGAYLARAGLKTMVVGEATPPLLPLFALDPRVVKDLRLTRHGLQYSVRDVTSVSLRSDGVHLALPRDLHAASRSLARHSRVDAKEWPRFRRRLFKLARSCRGIWWEDDEASAALRAELEMLSALSAAAWLSANLESDMLKALIAFDVASCGISPYAPGSALALVWRAAQEIGGSQGAKVFPLGGEGRLLSVLEKAAIQTGATVNRDLAIARIRATGSGVDGVEFAGGEFVAAPIVLSAFSRHRTLAGFLPRGLAGFDTLAQSRAADIVPVSLGVTLAQAPSFYGEQHPLSAHFVVAEKLESFASAEAQLHGGETPHEPVLGFTVEGDRLSLLVWPSQANTDIAEKVLCTLEAVLPGAKNASVDYLVAPDADPVTAQRLMSSFRERVTTPIPGLYLCGAEPVEALSGRAARMAAGLAVALAKKKDGA